MPYRDDRRALEAVRDDLRRELDELRPRAAALRDVLRAEEAVERELAATEARLANLDARSASLLDDARVASPCNASWDAMVGDDRVRFCGQCEKHVYNLSAMARDDANRLLAEREGSLCIRLYRRADGTVITADCPVGVRKKRVRLALYGAAGAGALAAAAALASTMLVMGARVRPPPPTVVWGQMAERPESYVPQPLRLDREPGLVFFYRQEPQPDRLEVEWRLWADGRATRSYDGVPLAVRLDADAQAAVRDILALSRELRAEATGAVPAYGDSAVPRTYELFGTGKRQAADADRARLFELAGRLPAPGATR